MIRHTFTMYSKFYKQITIHFVQIQLLKEQSLTINHMNELLYQCWTGIRRTVSDYLGMLVSITAALQEFHPVLLL